MKPFRPIRCLLVLLLLLQGMMGMAQQYVLVQGEVDSLMVLPKLGPDSAYLVKETLTVVEGGDLRIEAGAKVYFFQSTSLRVDGGKLRLDGQPNDSIYLLCYEFSHDWSGVQLKNVMSEDSVRFSYVEVVGALTALQVTNSEQVTVDHCRFNNYYAGKGIELVDCNKCRVDSCFFSQCVSGIELKARADHSEGNWFTHNIFDQGQINIEISNVGYGYKCSDTHVSDNCFQGAATAISFETVGGISDKDATNFIENNLISSDLPEGGSSYSSYGIKAAMDSLVIRNNVFWRNDEAVRMMRVCHLVFEHNTFYDNGLVLTNLLASGSASFLNNTISEAKDRIVNFASGKSRMNGNNFLHYKKDMLLFANVSTEEVDMRGNYWDAESVDEIESVIFDMHDVSALGEIVYDGYLSECDTTAPVSPPFGVKKQFVNNNWLISWDENPEIDVDQYVLFYGNFNYYKFANHTDAIEGNSYILTPQQAENAAVMACDRAYDPSVYASAGQSAYAFAVYYPYAGRDASMCAPSPSYTINDANIPYTYSGFVWRTSGTGVFSDSLSLRPSYYPSEADFEAGEVTLTLRVVNNGMVKTDAMQLELYKELRVMAGEDYYGSIDRPLLLDQAEAYNYDSLRWRTLGDGRFEDIYALHTVYYPGDLDKEQGFVNLILEAWSFCGRASSTIRFDLFKDYALEGKIWMNGVPRPNTQVIAASMGDGNQFMSGFYRTVSDAEGAFRFEALLPDTYVMYAFPDTLDVEAGGCYYLGDLQWNESNMIEVDGDVYDVDIVLPSRVQGFDIGEGYIGGIFDLPEMPFRARDFYCQSWLREGDEGRYCTEGLSNVGVLLLDASKQRMLGFALTDRLGKFGFGSLPFGTYYVMADLPRYGRGLCEEITLSPEQPSVSDLHLYVNDEGKVKMRQDDHALAVTAIGVFPNPAEDKVTLCGLKGLTEYDICVFNGLGGTVIERKAQTNLLGEYVITVTDWPAGVYFIRMTSPTESSVVKCVKH